MLGLVQKVLFNLIESLGGQEKLIEIKRLAGVPLDKEFRLDSVYSDEEWQNLYNATLEVLKISAHDADVAYADAFGNDIRERFPVWFQMSKNSYEFLARQPKIHNTLATCVADPDQRNEIQDKFRVETFNHKIITFYKSPNKLCGLYKALAQWIANYYGDEIIISEDKCMLKGDNSCELHIEWKHIENA